MGASLFVAGCQRPQGIDVDLTASPPRFVVDHHGWPRPFWAPRVREFAIASEDAPLWQLESVGERGEAARELIFAYGDVPTGFRQIFPEGNEKPALLKRGRTYFVAAGGKKTLYRMVFSLPLDALEIHAQVATRPAEP